MSPHAGFVLMEEIAPRLRNIIPNIKPVGAEDTEELLQDAMAVAAKMLHDLENRGKTVTPGNVVYYTVLHMKSGRRSYSAGRTDTMGSGTQLDGLSTVLSFETPAGIDPETGDEIPLGDMLAGHHEDPAQAGARNVDWDQFLATHDTRFGPLLKNLGEGRMIKESGCGYDKARHLKKTLAVELREFMGEEALADAMRIPAWRGNIQADHERAACRADRRH